jgi:hypothetical protein
MLTNDRSLSAHHAPVSPVETRPEPYFRGTLPQAGRCRLVGGSESHGSARTRHEKNPYNVNWVTGYRRLGLRKEGDVKADVAA